MKEYYGHCYEACKQLVRLCDELHMKGKTVIRIRKIVDIADEAIRKDDSALSNTGESEETEIFNQGPEKKKSSHGFGGNANVYKKPSTSREITCRCKN